MSCPPAKRSEPLVRIATERWGEREFFGGLAVAGVVVHPQASRALSALRLEGWQTLPDRELLELARKVEKVLPAERLLIEARKYNKAAGRGGGAVELLRWAHGRVVSELLKRYPDCEVVLAQPLASGEVLGLGRDGALPVLSPGEGFRDSALDAAGILARGLFFDRRVLTQERIGFDLCGDPRVVGRQILEKHGEPLLYDVAKMDLPVSAQILAGGDA